MYLYSVPASSEEDFIHTVISTNRRIGLDLVRGYVLSEAPLPEPYLAEGVEQEAVELCRGRPPLPVATYYPARRGGGPRVGAAMAPHGVVWLQPIGILRRGREWKVATSCKTKPPLAGWERTTVDAVSQMLYILSYYFWRFWPRGLRVDPHGARAWAEASALLYERRVKDAKPPIDQVRGAVSPGELMHVFVAGASASGKTTLVKSLIKGRRYVVIDITPKGEYSAEVANVVEGGIDFSSYTVDERIQLLTLAFAATLGKGDASFSPVQFGVLRRFGSLPLTRLISEIVSSDIPPLTKQVLVEKLSSLCVSLNDEYVCTPHPALKKSVRIAPPAAVRVSVQDQFLQSVVVHGILMRLLKEPQPEHTFIVIDEYHKIAAKVENIEDPVEQLIRMGRHGNWHVVISTQSPLELKPSLLSIIPSHIYFQLHGEAARLAAEILNVDEAVMSSLGPSQWLAVVRSGVGVPAWHRRSP
jgi:nucleoside-triphosphatase THEP1